MIPLLYQANQTDFTTLGIGALRDTISCKVRESRNGIFELELEYPIDSELFKELKNERIIVADANKLQKNQRFIIHRISVSESGRAKIYAEHTAQYKTKNNALKPDVYFSGSAADALNTWKNNLLYDSGLTVYSNVDTVSSGHWTVDKVSNARKALGGVEGSILDVYGGEYYFNNDRISLLNNRGVDSGVTIAYSKNLIGITHEQQITDTITSIQPYTIMFVNEGTQDVILTLPEDVVHSEYAGNYNHLKILAVNFSGEGIETVEQLRARANQYIADNRIGIPKGNLKINFVDLSDTLEYKDIAKYEELNLCDQVKINYEDIGIIDEQAQVVETLYDVLLERYEQIEVGSARSVYTSLLQSFDERITKTENVAIKAKISAGGKNTVYDGVTEPTGEKNDIWYKPVANNEWEMWIHDGAKWEQVVDTTDISTNATAVEAADAKAVAAQNDADAALAAIDEIELTPGPQGDSAYQVAVASGFVGTQAEWLASLVGEPGQDGTLYTIGSDGYWYADGVKTTTKAIGQDGANYTIGSDGFWYLNGTKTSYRAIGEKGDKGDDGRGVQSIKEYYLASAQNTGVTTSTSGWTETPQTITKAKPYLWNYSVTTYTTGATHTDQPVIIGTVGDDGVGIQSVQEYYLISNQATGVTHSTSGWTTTPPSFTDAKRFLWNYEKITYTDSSVTNTAPALIGVKGEQGDNFAWNLLKGTSDQLKQVSISGWGVTNASSLHPDNANLFSDGVISAGDTVTLRVWLDASQSAYPVRASIRYPNNGNPNRNTITNLIPAGQSGWATATATIPDDTTNFFVLITVFNQGSTPSQNIGYKYLMLNKGDAQPWSPHPDDLKALQTYTWIRYADSATGSGISNDPTGKTYIGFAYNKTTATESNTPSDYTWSLIKGTDGQPGAPGQDGTTTYTWIKYSDNADGTGLYDLPKSTTEYIGIAVNKTTATESTNKADYTWSKFRGGQGVPGTDGTGIQSIIVEYGISGTTAPTTWSTTPPESWDDDKYLWIRNKITYTDSTVAYAGTNRLSDVEAQRALVKAKEYTDNVKIGGKNIIKNSNDFSAFYAYSGATLTKTENVSVSEWNATDATNLKTTGGTNVLKITQRYEVPEVIHKEIVTYSIYVKNNGTNNITVRVNGVGAGTSETIEPGAAVRFVRFGGYRSEAYYNWFSFQIYASNAAENIDVDLWHDQLERGNKETDWSPAPEDFQTQITEIAGMIDLRVTRDSQNKVTSVTLADSSLLFRVNENKVQLTDECFYVANNLITNRMVASGISADKITVGTLNGANVNVVNLNASAITAGVITGVNAKFDLNNGIFETNQGIYRNVMRYGQYMIFNDTAEIFNITTVNQSNWARIIEGSGANGITFNKSNSPGQINAEYMRLSSGTVKFAPPNDVEIAPFGDVRISANRANGKNIYLSHFCPDETNWWKRMVFRHSSVFADAGLLMVCEASGTETTGILLAGSDIYLKFGTAFYSLKQKLNIP